MTSDPEAAPPPLPDPYSSNWVWRVSRMLARGLFVFWLDYRVRGVNRLPAGGALVLANHQSFLDPLLLGVAPSRPISYVARHTLFRVPVVGWFLRNTYVMAINRDAAGSASIREGARRLEHGFLVGMFPEGTRSDDGRLGEIKPGFISLLRRQPVAIVPAGIAGAGKAMPRVARVIRPARVRAVFGQPIPVETVAELSARGREAELLLLVRERIAACVGEAEAWLAGGA